MSNTTSNKPNWLGIALVLAIFIPFSLLYVTPKIHEAVILASCKYEARNMYEVDPNYSVVLVDQLEIPSAKANRVWLMTYGMEDRNGNVLEGLLLPQYCGWSGWINGWSFKSKAALENVLNT